MNDWVWLAAQAALLVVMQYTMYKTGYFRGRLAERRENGLAEFSDGFDVGYMVACLDTPEQRVIRLAEGARSARGKHLQDIAIKGHAETGGRG